MTDEGWHRKHRLGDILVEQGLITRKQLVDTLKLQREKGIGIGEALVEQGTLAWQDISIALSRQMNLPFIEKINVQRDPSMATLIPRKIVEHYNFVPIAMENNTLTIATDDPMNLEGVDELRYRTGKKVSLVVTSREEIKRAVNVLYGKGRETDVINEFKILQGKMVEEAKTEEEENAPIVRLVNRIVLKAIEENASDIHVEPETKGLRIRYRVDGMLRKYIELPKNLRSPMVSRIKLMSRMNIAEKRLPQDGRFFLNTKKGKFDFRVSTLPTIYGEKVMLRILRVADASKKIEELGLNDYNIEILKDVLKVPYGIILVTGPTGSGKTTTLVAIINRLNEITRNIVTIEDPVEYQIEGANQVSVNSKIGLTFANLLRRVLRQDPDVIMVGEIRDRETAQIATEAAMTGHLVLSTLHTNDAPSTIARLVNLGIDPHLISLTVVAIIAQRLIRTLCTCSKRVDPSFRIMESIKHFDMASTKRINVREPVGCDKCDKTGYRGRTAIHEIMKINDKTKAYIQKGVIDELELRKLAIENGMRTMFQDGLWKVICGITTLEEIVRVTRIS
ncbi:MAG: Flp pilus assembly complex ATPase component TadA [Thermotogae bacterium]|nr:Flp pilus assembly complex ATPase component TadA [Thermotogota bacterium]